MVLEERVHDSVIIEKLSDEPVVEVLYNIKKMMPKSAKSINNNNAHFFNL